MTTLVGMPMAQLAGSADNMVEDMKRELDEEREEAKRLRSELERMRQGSEGAQHDRMATVAKALEGQRRELEGCKDAIMRFKKSMGNASPECCAAAHDAEGAAERAMESGRSGLDALTVAEGHTQDLSVGDEAAHYREEAHRAEAEVAKLKSELEAERAEADRLAKELSSAKEEAEALSKADPEHHHHRKSSQSASGEREEERLKLKRRVKELESALRQAGKDYQAVVAELEDAKEAREEADRLRDELNRVQASETAQLEEAKSQIAFLERERDELEHRMAELSAKSDQQRHESEALPEATPRSSKEGTEGNVEKHYQLPDYNPHARRLKKGKESGLSEPPQRYVPPKASDDPFPTAGAPPRSSKSGYSRALILWPVSASFLF